MAATGAASHWCEPVRLMQPSNCTEAVPTVAGSHMSMFRPMPRLARDDSTNSPPGEVSTRPAFNTNHHVESMANNLSHGRSAHNVARLKKPASLQSVSRVTMPTTVTAWTRPSRPNLRQTGTAHDVLWAMVNLDLKKAVSTPYANSRIRPPISSKTISKSACPLTEHWDATSP